MTTYAHNTWLQPEEFAYPNGGQTRKGAAIYPDGKVRRIHAGIPDTYFSIPAHGRIEGKYVGGYVTVDDRLLNCPNLNQALDPYVANRHPDGELHCELCQFGLVDSPTRGALLFHPRGVIAEETAPIEVLNAS